MSLSLFRRIAVLLVLIASPVAAMAQASPDVVRLDRATAELARVDAALDTRLERADRVTLRTRAQAVRADTIDAATQLQGELARIDARLAQLGAAASGEDATIAGERSDLSRQRRTIDAAMKRGRLLSVEAQQLVEEIQQGEVAEFSQKVLGRAPSPLTPAWWSAIIQAVPRDLHRIQRFVADEGMTIGRARGVPWPLLLGLAVALLLLGPGRLATARIGQRLLIDGAPGRRVRRSANAVLRVVVGTLAPLLAIAALAMGARWSGLVSARMGDLVDAVVVAVGFGSFTSTVLGAVLMRGQPSWRIAPVPDAVAQRLRPYSFLLAILAATAITLDAANIAIGTSNAARVAAQAAIALLYLSLIAAVLIAIGRLRAAPDGGDVAPAATGLAAVALLAWGIVALALASLVIGFIGFSLFLGQMVAWTIILGSAVYLLLTAIDDVATSLFERHSRLGVALAHGLGVRGGAIDQFGVLSSGVLRVVLAVVALGLWITPFGGSGVASVFTRLGDLARGIQVGSVTISPGAILRSIAVLAIGLALVRAFMRWLEGRYLPATDLDGSGRNSISLVARYVGIAIAVIWALASLGIGVERIALLLSALSVGIGFGLQAITQNFVSGLILLAERPIKIGDLIRVGTDEGDVKRISVRSTEITLADHSTLIVPNSELITKSVLNKTLASPLGRIQVQFSVPLGTDAARVRQIVLDAFARETAVLDDPAPAAFVDAIVDGRIAFNCFAHVDSPRTAYGARSNVLLELLTRFRDEGIEMGTVPQRLELVAQADRPPLDPPPALPPQSAP